MILLISFIALGLAFFYVVLILFLKKGWENIKYMERCEVAPSTSVSVVIAARNESDKIHLTIEALLKQDYPKHLLEIIIVDDHSTDHTAEVIKRYKEVKLIQLNESEPLNSYKKKAIATAINVAKGEIIVSTDADCIMESKWLSTLICYQELNDFNFVSAPVIYHQEKSVFERMQTLEFLYLIGLGAAGIGNKLPATCNGANLLYKKSIFFELGGFKGIDDVASGDDELFMHKVAKAYPDTIGFCKSYAAVVFTHAKPNIKSFLEQRKRWASKSIKHKNPQLTLVISLIWIFNLSLIINPIVGIFNSQVLFIYLLQLSFKLIVELIYLYPLVSFAKRKSLIFYLLFLTPSHPLYFVYIGLIGNSGKYNWKGRLVK